MAVLAKYEATVYHLVEISAVYRYYKLQASTLTAPSKPLDDEGYPPDGWATSEPAFSEDTTSSLYTVECTVLTDGTCSYSAVSLSSSYEAAKTAYNSAIAAGQSASEALSAAQSAQSDADNLSDVIGGVQGELDSAKEDIVGIQNSNAEVYEVVYQNQSKISELVQVSSGFEMSFQTITDSIVQINDQYVTDRDEQYKYIRFIDGEIWIGKLPEEGEDDLQLVMRNDRISFLLNNIEIAYFSDDALYVTNVTVTGKLTVGRWEWSERSSGNMGLRWVGGDS